LRHTAGRDLPAGGKRERGKKYFFCFLEKLSYLCSPFGNGGETKEIQSGHFGGKMIRPKREAGAREVL